ncbi:MAG: glycoside hydrolase family 71/99 protein [Ignavibacteriaceae bacterium]
MLPYVNHLRWGAQQRPDSNGESIFLIPLPNPGIAYIQVIAVKAEPNNWMGSSDRNLLIVGNLMPGNKGLRSNEIEIKVQRRQMPKLPDDSHLFCIQYENYFEQSSWETAEAVPLIGFYDSYDEDVIRQHILWFDDMGVNSIMLDWSNHIWGDTSWNQRGEGARAIISNTTFFLEVLAKMRDEGIEVPKVVIMPGLSNGPPATMGALNEELDWIYQNYILNPRFKGLFLVYNGKPLMIILDTGAIGNKKGTAESAFRIPFFKQTLGMSASELDSFRVAQGPIDDSHFTIRYMSSQNQLTRHNELGYWSWMDGQLKPIVTYYNGEPEAVTVTPSFFDLRVGLSGWTAPDAYGRRDGTTYLETFKVALKYRPRVIFLHQFNEFAGETKGQGMGENKDIFGDEYSVELSDDIEPVSLTADGYRGDKGGWGFYYLNLTRALLDIFRGEAKGSTLLAVAPPEISESKIKLEWSVVGVTPKNFTVAIDGNMVLNEIRGTECEIPIDELVPGKHTITVTANGVSTHYALSEKELNDPSETPMPVSVSRIFKLKN